MTRRERFETHIRAFFRVLEMHREAYDFIRHHRLWHGFLRRRWLIALSGLLTILISWRFLTLVWKWVSGRPLPGVETSESQSNLGFIDTFSLIGKEAFQIGTAKYVALLLIEVVIFHFAVKTLNILEGRDRRPTVNDFIRAEIRMFKVVIRSWIVELILIIVVSVLLGLVGFTWLKALFIFGIQCYYLGFAYIDNYNEQYDISIRDSAKIIRGQAGASVALGLVSFVVLFVPIAGPVAAPILGAVTASLYMHTMQQQRSAKKAHYSTHM